MEPRAGERISPGGPQTMTRSWRSRALAVVMGPEGTKAAHSSCQKRDTWDRGPFWSVLHQPGRLYSGNGARPPPGRKAEINQGHLSPQPTHGSGYGQGQGLRRPVGRAWPSLAKEGVRFIPAWTSCSSSCSRGFT